MQASPHTLDPADHPVAELLFCGAHLAHENLSALQIYRREQQRQELIRRGAHLKRNWA
jgi:hypothetical protein